MQRPSPSAGTSRPFLARIPLALVLGIAIPSLVTPRVGAQYTFVRPTRVDPPSQRTTAEFLVGESGGLEPRRGTAWKVHYARGMHKGLYITGAWFKRNLEEDWIKILGEVRVAELFVPYHQASYIRYFDLTG